MKTALVLVLALATATGLGSNAGAQYRPGPTVMARPAPSNPNAAVDSWRSSFAAWNTRAGRPKMIIWWNREFSDETQTERDDVTQETVEWDGATRTTTTRHGTQKTTGGTYGAIERSSSRTLENGFVSTFTNAGARILDRDALVRRVSVGLAASDRADLQFIESKAVSQGAEYLIEVLPEGSNSSSTGLSFAISVKHVPTSRVVAQFVTTGAPSAASPRWVATDHGYERYTDSRISPENIATQIAAESMQRITGWH